MADTSTWAVAGATALLAIPGWFAWFRDKQKDDASYVTHAELEKYTDTFDNRLEKYSTNERVGAIEREIREVKRDVRDLRTENNTGFKDVLAAIKRNGGSH